MADIVSLELPGGVKVLGDSPLDPRTHTDLLASIEHDVRYKIGFSPIYNEDDDTIYRVSGGSAATGWTFEKITPEGISAAQSAAIVANTAKNSYPSADATKLSGIEDNATADQTGAEIVAALNTELGDTVWQAGGASNISAGAKVYPNIVDNGNGTLTVEATDVNIYNNNTFQGEPETFTVAEKTLSFTDKITSYVVVRYNAGVPDYFVTTTLSLINFSDMVPIVTVNREGLNLAQVAWGSAGVGTTDKLMMRDIKTKRFEKESGLSIGQIGTRNLTVTSGVVWNGSNRQALDAVDTSSGDTFEFYSQTGGVWGATTETQVNNTHYNNGTDLTEVSAGEYVVHWVYRGIVDSKLTVVLASPDVYADQATADAATQPTVFPDIIKTHCYILGRFLYLKGDNTAEVKVIENLDGGSLSATSDHEALTGIQGGIAGEHNHLSNAELAKLGGIEAGANNYTHPATHTIAEVSGLQTALDGKVDDSQVLTDVPAGAVFTDTVYTHPASHTASQISDFDAEVSNNTSVVANTNKRSYPSADETKLAGIEANATADQTGAEIETLLDTKLGNTNWRLGGGNYEVTPQMFGAVGDGITDDSAAFQAMFDAIDVTNPQSVFIPSLTYLINTQVNLPRTTASSAVLRISGYGAILKTTAGITILKRIPTDQTDAGVLVSAAVIIEGLTFAGTSAVDSMGLYLGATYASSIKDCYFIGFDNCLKLAFALMTEITNTRFQAANKKHIDVNYGSDWGGGLSTSQSNSTTLRNVRIFASDGSESCVHVESCSGVHLDNVICEGGNPINSIVFDASNSTVVKEFSCRGLHLENTPTNAHIQIKNFAHGTLTFKHIFTQYGAKLVENLGGADLVIVVEDVPWVPGSLRFAGAAKWIFKTSTALKQITEDPTYWTDGVARGVFIGAVGIVVGDFTYSTSFSGYDTFKTCFGRDVRIDTMIKDTSLSTVLVGVNGASPTDITTQLPLTLDSADTLVFEAIYDKYEDVFFTLIGVKL